MPYITLCIYIYIYLHIMLIYVKLHYIYISHMKSQLTLSCSMCGLLLPQVEVLTYPYCTVSAYAWPCKVPDEPVLPHFCNPNRDLQALQSIAIFVSHLGWDACLNCLTSFYLARVSSREIAMKLQAARRQMSQMSIWLPVGGGLEISWYWLINPQRKKLDIASKIWT